MEFKANQAASIHYLQTIIHIAAKDVFSVLTKIQEQMRMLERLHLVETKTY